ncbi:MAG: 16S rRNA (cytidine(1402)-2'-O)-methyltransferase [Bacteroidetes bacterium 4572_128]|nr:MAG: 16S rRNA (cytidine(1402)-2'-O)-methyltransferase [Bacteroidetes bacterium 4572_128]
MSKLYIVPTPIGNLEDITFRALKILKKVDFIMAEDTRKTSFLLKHYEIQNKLYSHHKFNEHKNLEKIINQLKDGNNVALVSDAGTPSISDPGFLLVKSCIEEKIEVECLPGATAFIPALVNSGFPNDKFCFEGFLPKKKGKQKRLKELMEEKRTLIFYESPYRVLKTLEQFMTFFGEDRKVSVSRELTKLYEETKRGNLKEVYEYFKSKKIKGEFVIILEGKK